MKMHPLGGLPLDLRHSEYNSLDFSLASEYSGPSVSHQMHRALPVDLRCISFASSFAAPSSPGDVSIPVVHPVSRDSITQMADRGMCSSVRSSVGDDNSMAESSENSSRFVSVEAITKSSLQRTHLHHSEFSPCSISCSEERTGTEPEEKSSQLDVGAAKIIRKGTCHQCGKGNRLTRKEICIVCCSQYCGNCVRKCMGSMPEGRKCIACVGLPVNEKMRDSLGSSFRLSRKVFSSLEVEQILRRETSCDVNLPSPEAVIVNRKALCEEEISLLCNCSSPPKKLEPGRFWYDKVSGLWGKEGKKPSQFITPQLNVGGALMRDASNGNTNIMINNREITKAEQLMLKFAGIYCDNGISFWVGPDGSCQEEGHKFVKGQIWEKAKTKIVCAVLGLPLPPKGLNNDSEELDMFSSLDKTVHKFILFGPSGAGTSTFYKQAKILYDVPFTDEERECIKIMIQCNLYRHLGILSQARELFENQALAELRESSLSISEEKDGGGDKRTIYTLSRRLKPFSNWLVQMVESGNLETMDRHKNVHLVEELWKDPSIRSTYSRRNELPRFPGSAYYFLSRASEILSEDYMPSDTDILSTEGIPLTSDLASMEFSFPPTNEDEIDGPYWHDPSSTYQMTRLHPQLVNTNCLELLEDEKLLLFCVSLTDYNMLFENDDGTSTNAMISNRRLFEKVAAHRAFQEKVFLLVLTKVDLLADMIEDAPLTNCEWFEDFDRGEVRPASGKQLAQRVFHHVACKFKKVMREITGKKLFVAQAVTLDVGGVDETLRYAREVLKWQEHGRDFSMEEVEEED